MRRMWADVADPALGGFERLFFALYGRALQGDEPAGPLLEDDLESWLEANVAVARSVGVPADVARVHARLGLAVTRGLLLDLLATGDRAGVDAALEVFARRYAGRWWEPDGASTVTQRPRLVEAAVARAHREGHLGAHLDAAAPVGDGRGMEPVGGAAVLGHRAEAACGVERGDAPVTGPGGRDGAGHVSGRSWTAGSPGCRWRPGRAAPG